MEARDPDPRLRAWRMALLASILAGFGLLGGLIVVAEAAEAKFFSLNMLALPALTELCFDLVRLLRAPLAILVAAAAGMGTFVAAFRGNLDSRAKPLTIVMTIVNLGLLCFFLLALYIPISRLHIAK